ADVEQHVPRNQPGSRLEHHQRPQQACAVCSRWQGRIGGQRRVCQGRDRREDGVDGHEVHGAGHDRVGRRRQQDGKDQGQHQRGRRTEQRLRRRHDRCRRRRGQDRRDRKRQRQGRIDGRGHHRCRARAAHEVLRGERREGV
ncbi:MAG: hypothetical protein AVDCRST_MAG67-3431, partial [uncultured Solirubrobacteraceae bacterium]